jgi:hypothetical protein
VAAVDGGLITADQACKRYKLTLEEFSLWQRAFEAHGTAGLRVARVKRAQKSDNGSQKKT